MAGSSPLARGLPTSFTLRTFVPGIIPARAGFTDADVAADSTHVDHPRSRGVYISGACAQPISRGSSPLARGLPGECDGEGRVGRIIPARAGFTWMYMRACVYPADHPRSRGVYTPRHGGVFAFGGSSPLARGLR